MTEALKIYEGLISELPVSPSLYVAFENYFKLETDLDSILRITESLLERTKNAVFPSGLAMRIAWMYELSGRTDEARALYEREFSAHGSMAAHDAAVRLLLEMNDKEKAAALLASRKDAEGSGVLAGQSALQTGDTASARTLFNKVLEKPDSAEDSLRAMFGAYLAARAEGNRKDADEAAAGLAKAFPLSPEAAIARASGSESDTARTRISAAAVPARYFGGVDSSTFSAVRPSAVEIAPKVSVQAGSFTMRENAEDLSSVLTGRGFSVKVRESDGSGRKLYRVFAASAVSAEDAKAVVLRLQELGFYGFIVPDTE